MHELERPTYYLFALVLTVAIGLILGGAIGLWSWAIAVIVAPYTTAAIHALMRSRLAVVNDREPRAYEESAAEPTPARMPQVSRRSTRSGSEPEGHHGGRVIEVEFSAGTGRPGVIVDRSTWPYGRASFETIEKWTGMPAEEAKATLDAGHQIQNALFRFWSRPVHNEMVDKVNPDPTTRTGVRPS